jgi:hypothetical protein
MLRVSLIIALLLVVAVAAHAGPVLTLTPANLFGAPGQIIGFSGTIHNDLSDWISVVSITLTDPGAIGTSITSCFDSGPPTPPAGCLWFAQDLGGPTDGAIAPNSTWNLTFDPVLGKGLAEYLIDPGTPVGSTDGFDLLQPSYITVLFQAFTDDPATCGSCEDPIQEAILNSSPTTAQFTITATTATPEPGTVSFLGVGGAFLAAMAFWRRRHAIAPR